MNEKNNKEFLSDLERPQNGRLINIVIAFVDLLIDDFELQVVFIDDSADVHLGTDDDVDARDPLGLGQVVLGVVRLELRFGLLRRFRVEKRRLSYRKFRL